MRINIILQLHFPLLPQIEVLSDVKEKILEASFKRKSSHTWLLAPTQDNSVFVVKTLKLNSKCAYSQLSYSFDGLKYTSPYCDGDREDDYGGENKAPSTLESASNDDDVAAQFKNEIQVFIINAS